LKEASLARAIISDAVRRAAYEPHYDVDSQTGASVLDAYRNALARLNAGSLE